MKRTFLLNLFLLFFIGAFAQSNRFPPDGNAGIGSIVPLNGLHLFNLNNFSSGSIRLGHSGSHDAVLSFGWNGFDQDAFKISTFPHLNQSEKVDLLSINKNGNVGIGTNNPQSKLEIIGQLAVGGTGAAVNYLDRSDNNKLFQFYSLNGKLHLYTFGYGGDGDKLTITNDGNLGIGTTTPLEKLTVNGKIRAHEIKVETSNWPDYVFEESYPLRSLSEIEKQIKNQGHLPDMPSAKDLETNGLAIGEMLNLQQKKIEELTLYLIDKDKAIKLLESENSILQDDQTEIKTSIKKLWNRIEALESKNKL